MEYKKSIQKLKDDGIIKEVNDKIELTDKGCFYLYLSCSLITNIAFKIILEIVEKKEK